jgi:hypothetical protein
VKRGRKPEVAQPDEIRNGGRLRRHAADCTVG